MNFKRKILASLFGFMVVMGCDPKENKETQADYDQTALLSNVGEQVILPAYTAYQQALSDLEQATSDWSSDGTTVSKTVVGSSYVDAYLAWQKVAMYDFGPAKSVGILVNTNTYPVDTVAILNQISSGNFALDAIANTDAIGFPALDYLLFADLDSSVTTDANYVAYVHAVVEKLALEGNAVATAWALDGGNYISTFKQGSGADVGSSVSLLVNSLNAYFETHLRDGKLGIPIGTRTLGEVLPERVEGYFSGAYSISLLAEAVNGLKDAYLGCTVNGSNAIGLDDYLVAIGAADLNAQIKAKLENLQLLISQQSGVLSSQVVAQDPSLAEIHAQFQQLAILLKVEMTARLGILITYQDSDGD